MSVQVKDMGEITTNADANVVMVQQGADNVCKKIQSVNLLKGLTQVEVGSAAPFYFGDASTDGSWRIVRSGNNLVFQRRESSTWNTKLTVTA